jgi:hypothetical protein
VISEYWPNKSAAQCCIKSIRRRRLDETVIIAIDTQSLEISDDMKFITVNGQQELFLQYDNQDKTGNRILVFFSETGAKIVDEAKEWIFQTIINSTVCHQKRSLKHSIHFFTI